MSLNIRLYNALSRSVEPFEPIEPGKVRMYNCGPTVYDYAHIGNFRAFVFADLLRRFFEFAGYDVTQVMNITDVGHMTEDQLADGGGQDKMELAADRLKRAKKQGAADVDDPGDPYQVAGYFAQAFIDDARALRLKIADDPANQMPHATAYVPQMIDMVKTLVDKGHAYATEDGAVYYDVQSFPQYGRLSGNTLDKLQSGAGGRVDDANPDKRNAADFALWKSDEAHLMKWDSPWTKHGFPGWHIECSAMARKHLGDTLDIHTGGEDNIFPHHECEIAQSRCATGAERFARHWFHARFLLVEGEKMSKSKGNFYTVRDLFAKGVDPAVLRYELLKTHYRSNMNFTMKGLEDSAKAVAKLRSFISDSTGDSGGAAGDSDVERAVLGALADDLNISGALGVIFKWLNETTEPTADDIAALRRIDGVLGVLDVSDVRDAASGDDDSAIDAKVAAMTEARANKDWGASDAIRKELTDAGIEVQIGADGITWKRKMRLD